MESTQQGLWYHGSPPGEPVAATISEQADASFQSGQIEEYWDAFELECHQANVHVFETFWRDAESGKDLRSIYVSDANRFPDFNGAHIPKLIDDGRTVFNELWSQEVYRPRLGAFRRLARFIQRS
jgi:hypothetical protein